MSKTRKVLSLLLALAMVFATLAVSASAASYYEDEEAAAANTQTWALGEPVDNGDGTYSVDVSLTTNYATGPIQFVITNTDNTIAAITTAALGEAIPAAYNASISASNATGKVIIVPSTAGVQTIAAQAIDGVIATITYTYSGSGSATIAIDNNPKSETNPAGSLIAARMSDGDVVTGDPITGQTVTATGEERTIGAAVAAAELALTATGTADGVKIDTGKTFAGAYAGAVYGFKWSANTTFRSVTYLNNNLTATNGGSLSLKTVDGAASGVKWGTGTTVEVLNADGTSTGKKYVVVIFGDINCDGFINATDTNQAKSARASASYLADNSLTRMAANTNAVTAALSHTINANDYTAVKRHVAGTARIDQAAVAAKHASFTTYYK